MRLKARYSTKMAKSKTSIQSGRNNKHDNSRKQKMFKINLVNDSLTRKQKRKEMRKLKKIKKNAFSRKESMPNLDEYLDEKKRTFVKEINQKNQKKEKIQNKIDKLKEIKLKKKIERDAEKARIDTEKEEEREERRMNKVEDRSLKDLEKKLNLNKKRKTLPQGFLNDGLDYLLEVIDGKQDIDYDQEKPDWFKESDEEDLIKSGSDNDEEFQDDEDNLDRVSDQGGFSDSNEDEQDSDIESGSDSETSDLKNNVTPKSILKKTPKSSDKKKLSWNEQLVETEHPKHQITKFDIEPPLQSKKNKKRKMESSESKSEEDEEKDEEEEEEDIYGRIKNPKGTVKAKAPNVWGEAYIPPAKRAMMMADSDDRKQILEKLKKQLKGLINRASESNIQSISNQIEEFYLINSRADINQTLTELIMAACIETTLTPERLIQELILLLSVLHCRVGMEIGAYFLQTVVTKLDEELCKTNYGSGKTVENILMIVTTLYNYQVIHSSLIFDIVKKFIENFTDRDIELLLFIIKNVGFNLRKDNPVQLKEIIQQMQSKATETEKTDKVEKSRIQFMLDVILAIKNNNMRKIPNYDPTRIEHLKKVLNNIVKGNGPTSNQICVTYQDLLQADNKGKWWLVGSAWSGRDTDNNHSGVADASSKMLSEANASLLKLAQKLRMNTDTRKCIFLILMTSEDFVDAFEKLLRLGLKNQQEREIIHVIMSCCLQEKDYNAYYAYIVQKFCQFDRRFQMTLQYSIWDKFKEMGNLSLRHSNNLIQVINHQLGHQAITLSILKVVEFGTLDKPMVNFLKQLLEELLLANSQDVIQSIFHKVAANDKLKHLQEGLKLFLVHFLKKKKTKSEASEELLLKIDIAEKALSEGQRNLLL